MKVRRLRRHRSGAPGGYPVRRTQDPRVRDHQRGAGERTLLPSCSALGYLDFTGNMDTRIAIRMAAKKNGIVTVQAGGGIVADSVPYNEYMESANKAKAVMNAIERASEVDG